MTHVKASTQPLPNEASARSASANPTEARPVAPQRTPVIIPAPPVPGKTTWSLAPWSLAPW